MDLPRVSYVDVEFSGVDEAVVGVDAPFIIRHCENKMMRCCQVFERYRYITMMDKVKG